MARIARSDSHLYFARHLGSALLGLIAISASPSLFAAPSPGFRVLPGHIPAAVVSAQKVSALDTTQTIHLALALPLRRQAELDDLLRGLSDPQDPRYGQYLTPEEFAARFSPTPAEYARVIAYAQSMGLTVTTTHANRTLLDVSAPAGQVNRAFGLHLQRYQSGTDGRYFYAPDADPQVSTAVSALVSGVIGLSDASLRKPYLQKKQPALLATALDPYALNSSALQPAAGSGPGGGFSPSDIKTAYGLNSVTQTGTGQTLGLFELAGYTLSDITAYENQFGLTHVPLQNVLVDSYSGAPGSGADEVTLDIELQIALAPGATKILVYEAPNSDAGVVDTYNKIATDNLAKSVSTSWGEAENSATASVRNSENTAFQQMAAQGQSIFAASGDSGAYDTGAKSGGVAVDDPASQPYMVGVGGTSLTTVSAGGAYKSEKTWNGGSVSAGAGGGGISTVWNIPSYQTGVVKTASKGSTTKRNVPDVSLNADPNTGYAIYYSGGWNIYGGTSCAAPLWSAFTALVNQKRVAGGGSTLGFANPPIYTLAQSGTYAADFHDIADGSTNLYYPAVTGYDDATGWGTFIGSGLLADLSGGTTAPSTINDTSTGILYTGSWAYYPSRGLGDVSDDVHATQTNGDSVSYTFTGSSVSYIAETNADEGDVQVYIDGTLQTTVSGYSATRKAQQTLWSTSGLSSGSHTLMLVKASGSWMLLDAIQAVPGAAPTTLNDSGSGLTYTGGSWAYYPSRGLGDVSDDVHATQTNGDSVSYTFTGSSVSYIAETNADEGDVQVYLDGTLQTTVSGYSATRKAQQTLWSTSGLSSGSHTLMLVKANGSWMLLDALRYQ